MSQLAPCPAHRLDALCRIWGNQSPRQGHSSGHRLSTEGIRLGVARRRVSASYSTDLRGTPQAANVVIEKSAPSGLLEIAMGER
jgi:hypothetical protein